MDFSSDSSCGSDNDPWRGSRLALRALSWFVFGALALGFGISGLTRRSYELSYSAEAPYRSCAQDENEAHLSCLAENSAGADCSEKANLEQCVILYSVIVGNTGSETVSGATLSFDSSVLQDVLDEPKLLRTGVSLIDAPVTTGDGRTEFELPPLEPSQWVRLQFVRRVGNHAKLTWEELGLDVRSPAGTVLVGDPRLLRFVRGLKNALDLF